MTLQTFDDLLCTVTTGGGYLRIKLEQVDDQSTNHLLGYKSGMLQSWNKFCFTGGYMEVRVQLPGAPTSSGYWPGAWTEGNLARPGYASTNDAMWPYSYDTCDIGTLPNQSYADRSRQPPAAFDLPPTVGRSGNNFDLSWLPGQRLSACTCPDDDHPGPKVQDNGGQRLRGRGAPEIDILEARLCNRRTPARGCATQSSQFAPFSALYDHDYTAPAWQIQAPDMSEPNYFKGSPTQQSVSCLVNVSDSVYAQPDAAGSEHGGFGIFGLEYQPSDDPASSYITWKANDRRSHTVLGTAVGPNADAEIGQRIISQEPMAMILNLAISESFQQVLLPTMFFPAEMLIDYVRVYQRKGSPEGSIGCDPPNFPTVKYIQDHIAAYDNANYTTWVQAGYQNPRNRLIEEANGRQC